LPTAALVTERGRLLDDLSLANSQLLADSEKVSHLVTGLRRHLAAAEEKERLRLAHELHDQAGQSLIAAILELNAIDALIDGPARGRLHLVRKRMEEMGKTLHRIAWELRPPAIDELGLRKALSSYIADWGEQCGADVDFHCDDPRLDEVPNEIGTAIYRIVQEGLTNIVKHAQRPSNVSIVIRRPDATLQVIVEDNGCGFEPGATAKLGAQRGLGLDGMRERKSSPRSVAARRFSPASLWMTTGPRRDKNPYRTCRRPSHRPRWVTQPCSGGERFRTRRRSRQRLSRA